jgi:hypothetical protein
MSLTFKHFIFDEVAISGKRSVATPQDETATVKIDIGKIAQIHLSPTADQYAELSSLVEEYSKLQIKEPLLMEIANWCYGNSVLFSCDIKSSNELDTLFDECAGELLDKIDGLLVWLPQNHWPSWDLIDASEVAHALLPHLSKLIDQAPKYLKESAQDELRHCIDHRTNFSLNLGSSFEKLASVVANIENGLGYWPKSACEQLLRLAQLPYFGAYDSIVKQVMRSIQPGTGAPTEASKREFIEMVCKAGGGSHLFIGSSREGTFHHAIGSVLQIAENESGLRPAPITSLSEIPETFVREALKAGKCDWLDFWSALTTDSKTLALQELKSSPTILLESNLGYTIPKELRELFSSHEVVEKLLTNPKALDFYADRLELFTSLPESLALKLIENNFTPAVERHLGSFTMKAATKADIIKAAIDRGATDIILPHIQSLSNDALKLIDKGGYLLGNFKKDSKIFLGKIYEEYRDKYISEGSFAAQKYVQEAWEILDALVGPTRVPDHYLQHDLYQALLSYGYPNNLDSNAEDFSDSIVFCRDRSDDFELFEVPQELIKMDLAGAVTIELRKDLKLEESVLKRIDKLLREPLALSRHEVDSNQKLRMRTQTLLKELGSDCSETDLDSGIVDLLRSAQSDLADPKVIKRACIFFHASKQTAFARYVDESVGRAEKAPNRDYAHLLELRDFFTTVVTDSLRETISRLRQDEPESYPKLEQVISTIYSQEVEAIDQELSKYVAKGSSGQKARTITAFFSKNEPSARMRAVAGVCVAVDNPTSESDTMNMWCMENYFQLVLRDEQTRRCVGGVLLHYYEEQDKRILTASLNPSSTLLYKVDEKMMLDQIVHILGEFAELNDIDIVAVSKSPGIRTNRTGGIFEQALNERIRLVGEQFEFEYEEQFSTRPEYSQQSLDVIWRREET